MLPSAAHSREHQREHSGERKPQICPRDGRFHERRRGCRRTVGCLNASAIRRSGPAARDHGCCLQRPKLKNYTDGPSLPGLARRSALASRGGCSVGVSASLPCYVPAGISPGLSKANTTYDTAQSVETEVTTDWLSSSLRHSRDGTDCSARRARAGPRRARGAAFAVGRCCESGGMPAFEVWQERLDELRDTGTQPDGLPLPFLDTAVSRTAYELVQSITSPLVTASRQ